MATSVTSTANPALKNLATTFQTAITATMDVAREPLKRIETARDTAEVRKGIYSDIKNQMDGLLSSILALNSSEDSYAFKLTGKATVNPYTPGSTVFTATSTESALLADYDIAVTKLAKAQTRASAVQTSADMALNKSGTLWLGGTGMAEVSLTPTGAVTAGVVSNITSGQRELGSGEYTVEVRESAGVKQFRLVDSDGKAVSVANTKATGFTAGWQTLKEGSYNTGRGLSVTLDSSAGIGASPLTYTARGNSIYVSASDTLRNVVNAINNVQQPEGRDLKASIVGKQLVFTAAATGENHSMVYSDAGNLFGFGADTQTAQNAEFTVNGISLSRSSNTNLTDIMDGVTLSLAGDAENKSARLSVAGDNANAKAAVTDLVKKFNEAFSFLTNKMATTSKTEGDKTTYTRGPLTGDLSFQGLRREMINVMNNSYQNDGSLRIMEDIGISFDDDLKLTLDATKLETVFKENPSGVTALLDKAMTAFENSIEHVAGSEGTLQKGILSIEEQLKDYGQRITRQNSTLTVRENALIKYYSQMQAQLAELGNTATMLGIDISS